MTVAAHFRDGWPCPSVTSGWDAASGSPWPEGWRGDGGNTVLLQLVAKGLLTGYRDEFGSLDGWGRASFVAEQVRGMVLERTAARSLIERLISAVPGRDEEVAVTRPRLAAQDLRGP